MSIASAFGIHLGTDGNADTHPIKGTHSGFTPAIRLAIITLNSVQQTPTLLLLLICSLSPKAGNSSVFMG